jgi:threonine/homoserine/homoserine lactone efflux protein
VQGAFWTSLVVFSAIFLVAGLCSSSSWMLGGAGLKAIIGNRRWVRAINIALALLLVASLWPIVSELMFGAEAVG